MEQIAKKKVGEDKVLNFLAYNKACGDLAKERKNENNVNPNATIRRPKEYDV